MVSPEVDGRDDGILVGLATVWFTDRRAALPRSTHGGGCSALAEPTAEGLFPDLEARGRATEAVVSLSERESRWGSVSSTPGTERDLPVRIMLAREAADTRIFVARLRREYRESGGRLALERLLRGRKDLPWYLRGDGGTGRTLSRE